PRQRYTAPSATYLRSTPPRLAAMVARPCNGHNPQPPLSCLGGARPTGAPMLFRQVRTFVQAFRDVFADSGFSMAGAVAYSFVLSPFPFCIFLGALAGYFGGEALARQAVEQLFQMAPQPVAEAIAPEVMAVMGKSRFGLLTFGAFIALFFATSAIESMRAAL